MKISVLLLAALLIALGAAMTIGSMAWRRFVGRLLAQMSADAHGRHALTARFFTEQLAALPSPVQRYFAFALSPGQPLVVTAQTTSTGEFRLRTDGNWHPFAATQYYSVVPRAFVWEAAISVGPFVDVKVTDRYLHGEGGINARVAGLLPVVDVHGTPELASGELMRYLAEAVLLPTALLPSSGVSWTAVDDSSASAALTDRGTTVSATFHFGPRGEIARVSALRYRDVEGKLVMTPWLGQFREYRSVQGMMVPMVGEVAWILPDGIWSYYRGRTTQIAFELAA